VWGVEEMGVNSGACINSNPPHANNSPDTGLLLADYNYLYLYFS
jgi:hypothetical protein